MVTREEVFRTIESLECEGIPFNVRAAEVLRQTWAERVEFECQLTLERHELLIEKLRECGIGLASLDEVEAYTRAVARGEFKPSPDDPKLWFTSIEAMADVLKRMYEEKPDEHD